MQRYRAAYRERKKTKMLELLRELSLLNGVSGDEACVSDYIIGQIKDYCDCHVDALGNVIAFQKGKAAPKNRVQLSAHMDEVGFIITYIEEDGLLRFTNAGGIDTRVTVGKAVRVGHDNLPGVIGVKPVHLLKDDERDTMPKMEDLTIDIGAKDRAQAQQIVSPGDRAVFESEFFTFGSGFIKGKALDDRAGCALMIKQIQRGNAPYDCYYTFTVQEETGCKGGMTAAYAVKPDIGIAIETTTAGDIADTPDHKKVCRLGGGPVLSFMDKGTIYDAALYTQGLAAAQEKGIRCQSKEGVYGGNESRSIQTARGGARVLAVSLPCRYLHSPSCVLQQSDIEETARLLQELTARFAQL